MLNRSWEQKKNSNNIFSKQEKIQQANKSVEQRQLDQFKEELAHNREQSKNNALVNKIMNGEDLTPEEEQYLARNNPAQLDNYRRAKAERKAYEEKLQKCKTKDEVQRLKTNTMNGYLSELKAAPGEAKAAKAMEILGKVKNILKAELHFVESGGYAKLPTEADEAIEKAEERTRENEEIRDALIDSLEAEDESREENAADADIAGKQIEGSDLPHINKDKIGREADTADNSDVDKNDFTDKERKRVKPKKKEQDPLEEIKAICKRYIPDADSIIDKVAANAESKTEGTKVLGKINITL